MCFKGVSRKRHYENETRSGESCVEIVGLLRPQQGVAFERSLGEKIGLRRTRIVQQGDAGAQMGAGWPNNLVTKSQLHPFHPKYGHTPDLLN